MDLANELPGDPGNGIVLNADFIVQATPISSFDVDLTKFEIQMANSIGHEVGHALGANHVVDATNVVRPELDIMGGTGAASAALHTLDPEVQAKIKVVFVTTDPARDTPAVMRAWLDH